VTWRLLLTAPLPGPENMALDHALMDRARRTGESVLRIYAWSSPTLSLGRHQGARAVYDEARLAERGIGVVRRPTGGRALLHHREVTYSVTAPLAHDEPAGTAYRRINLLLINALERLGVPASPAERARHASRPSGAPCFAEPSAGELLVAGRKLVGSAQWRQEGALLQHGSILVDDDQSRIAELMRVPPEAPPPAPATLRDAMGRAPVNGEVADALFDAVRALADPSATSLAPDDELRRSASSFVDHYRDDDWTWRR
jgi:lipoate-protein ligase A